MQKYFKFQEKTFKKLLKKKIKEEVKTSSKFIKFCNLLNYFLVVFTVLSMIATIAYLLIWSEYPEFDWMLGIISVGFPFGLSFLPKSVIWASLGKDYKFRKKNTLSIVQNTLIYSYEDTHKIDKYAKWIFSVSLKDITEIYFNKYTHLITISGNIKQNFTLGEQHIVDSCITMDLFNAYDEDVFAFLKKNINSDCKITVI